RIALRSLSLPPANVEITSGAKIDIVRARSFSSYARCHSKYCCRIIATSSFPMAATTLRWHRTITRKRDKFLIDSTPALQQEYDKYSRGRSRLFVVDPAKSRS